MKIYLKRGTRDLERIIALAQSWQLTRLGGDFTKDITPTNLIDPSGINDLVIVSTSVPSRLSDREQTIFFGTLSRLIDEFLLGSQVAEAWRGTAKERDRFKDVRDFEATCKTARQLEGAVAGDTLVEIDDKRRKSAARSAAHLVFSEVLNRPLELRDCENDRCQRRFIFRGRGKRFHSARCGGLYNARLARRWDKLRHIHNFHRIGIAIGAVAAWMLNQKGSWKLAVLVAWSVAEGRKDLRTRLTGYLSRRSHRVPKEIGCRLLGKIIDAALNQSNRALTQALIEECGGGSADDMKYIKALLLSLFRLVLEVEAIQTPSNTADEGDRVDQMMALSKKLTK